MKVFTPCPPADLHWWQVVALALLLLLAFFPWSAVPWMKGAWSP